MGIQIASKVDGFRRCGVAHSKDPVVYPDKRFSKAEIAALRAEPMLTVTEVDDEKKSAGDKGKK